MATSNDKLFQELGRLEGVQGEINTRLSNIEVKVDAINTSLSRFEGGRATALFLLGIFGTISGTIGGFAVWVWGRLH